MEKYNNRKKIKKTHHLGKEEDTYGKEEHRLGNLGFGYVQTDKRYVSNFRGGAWDEGTLTGDPNIVLNECAGVLQYAQTIFEGLKAYTTEDGRIVTFRPDLNAERMENSARRLEMPVFPKERFVEAVTKTVVRQRGLYVPPFGSRGDSLRQTVYVWKQSGNRSETGG